MKPVIKQLALVIFPGLLFFTSPAQAQQPLPQRAIAVTIDDLPAGAANFMSAQDILAMTSKLVGTLHDQQIPAVGFVNEQKLYKPGEVDDRIKALSLWLDHGLELGNHTFAHTSLNRVTLQAWEEEVVRGETVTRMLMAQYKMPLRYFRHPYLDTGRDLQTRRDAEAFLSSRGYQIAPVTMDGWDWMYATVYDDARSRGDAALQKTLVDSYLEHLTAVFDCYEKLSKDLFAYEPKQILLMHANWIEADHIGDVLDLLRKRGYKFISLEEALGDGAYSSPDLYVGEGTGWIDHWLITRGKPAFNEPTFPQWVIDRANELRHQMGAPPAGTAY
jgi:peptidoglycan/xylan/chitin deacetylase (PgdA/CDA1 family)